MKICLFYQDRIYNFVLPNEIEGSYSFDVDKNEESKLINIEARDGKWVIYSIDGAIIIGANGRIDDAILGDNSFYIIQKNNQNYLIYVCSIASDKMNLYSYNGLNLIIGNSGNISYNCPYFGNNQVRIYKQDDKFILQQSSLGITYVNNKIVSEPNTYLNVGDYINIYGFKIILLSNMLLMNNPGGMVNIPNFNFGISPLEVNDEPGKIVNIQDRDLYDKSSFYSKSPRIRRVIETKKIKLSPPPHDNNSEELPFILTVGPMLTMGMMSFVTMTQTFMKIGSGESTFGQSWPQLVMAFAMLASMLIWPIVMRIYNKRMKKRKRAELIFKYDEYLKRREKEIEEEVHLQRDILIENLITVNECLDIISKRNIGFWDKRIDQNDFLTVRLGMGRFPLDIEIEYSEEDFSIDDDDLRKKADELSLRYKYINNVPVGYSFKDNKITAIMGFDKKKSFAFTNNILLQLLTFYSYEDLKLVIFTNEENEEEWDYVRYLNHNFSNDKKFRFFATNTDSAKVVMDYLSVVMQSRDNDGREKEEPDKPHYLIIIDDYNSVKRFDFIKELTENDDDIGFSIIILEEKLSKLPSKCNNFISLATNSSSILKNSYEKQEQIPFKEEIYYDINMMNVAKIMSNIPIEFEEGIGSIPDSISFLEMHGVGKVEQLNVLNRWNMNDPTVSLKAEIGVDNQEDVMYLDLHEKAHGPHGLIAGTTGSGKSEFIITYILSMCINYSPDDISFILIDYKGGGLALAFENNNFVLPHLAGTITNLDKAEMDRTLVSIDSEAKRRQQLFNEARDITGESTMDIYKYQRLYKDGKLKEPVSHLFIICDEFAELKAQQPDFMDNLISIARIGRSLGVHLILATQKPSGVVNDQIWSNTRFRVCLKVQDESDSKEMLKKPDAAHIMQAGRYYLQVGYDEVYALGQSGYTGAKYYPSEKKVKQVDKSINFINDYGGFIKSIQASGGPKVAAQGEQLQAVMKLIIDTANKIDQKSKRLWLPNIPETILVDDLEKKYNYVKEDYHPKVIIGEYDAPEKQEQGQVIYDLIKDGNTAIYGNDGAERELLLSTLIYSLCKNYTAEEVNIYSIDYGSESLRRFESLPQVGGMVFQGDDEKYNNLIKMLKEEMAKRKKLFVDFGGEYSSYIKNSGKKLPVIVVIINNYDSISESISSVYEEYPDLVRDSDRYGVVYVFTGNGINSIPRKITQNFDNVFAYKLKDQYDYISIFNSKTKLMPRETFGRGLINNGSIHEFQTSKIVPNDEEFNEFLQKFINEQDFSKVSKRIPVLPDIVRFDNIKNVSINWNNVPVGISKNELEVETIDLQNSVGLMISSNKCINTMIFVKSLTDILNNMENTNLLVIDSQHELSLDQSDIKYYYTEDMDKTTESITQYIERLIDSHSNAKTVILIYNVSKYISKLSDINKLNELSKVAKKSENVSIIIADDQKKLKAVKFDEWFKDIFSVNDGIWIGKGASDQSLFSLGSITKEMMQNYKNDMGYLISESSGTLCRLIDFYTVEDEEKNE